MSPVGLPFQNSLHGLLTWFLDPRSLTLDGEGAHRPAALASHIAASYRELGKPASPAGEPVSQTGRLYDRSHYLAEDREYRLPVAELLDFVQGRMAPHLTHFFLHGSLATADYAKGWSDVDTLMVIRDETVTDGGRLLELRKLCMDSWELFLRICPLQHHGFIVATGSELSRYPSHYMPPPVLEEALALLPKQGAVRFHVCPGEGGALRSIQERRDSLRDALKDGVLRHHPKNGVYLEAGYRNAGDAMGQLFALLGYVMTVPAFLLDALGSPCYKRDSFARAKPLFSAEAWGIVERSSAVREEWGRRESTHYRGNAVPQWLQELLGPGYIEASHRFLEEAVTLAEKGAPVPVKQ